ncbi:apolipoprotein N-acyltransferase [bacterium]|nr:apolipoprotein N-acyltransferase [bacterium]
MRFLYLCLSALLLILSFPRPNLFPFAWFSLSLFIVSLKGEPPFRAFFFGWLFGFIFIGGLLYWILLFGFIPWFALALYQGFFFALFALLFSLLKGERLWGSILFASLWTGIEYIRSWGKFGFTWGSLAQSQFLDYPLLGITKIGGMFLLSFLIAFINGAIALHPFKKAWKIAISILFISHLLGYSINQIYRPEKQFKVAILQAGEGERVTEQAGLWSSPSVDQLIHIYDSLLDKIDKADLLVFPETAFPVSLPDVAYVREWVSETAKKKNSNILIGSPVEEEGKIYNSALLFSPKGEIIGRYDKVQLVPFGEFVPWRKKFPWLKKLGVRDFDFTPGEGWFPLKCKRFSLGVMICFESIFPKIAREMCFKGADFLVVITNDSWFGRTWAAEQHLAFSALRACEEGRYLLRSATTGISAFIAPDGQILKRTKLFTPAIIVGEIGKGKNTLYTYIGDYLLFFLLLPIPIEAIRRIVSRRGEAEEARKW